MRELVVWKEERLTEERPASARLVPEEERWKSGWLGRVMGMASDCRDPDMDRAWLLPAAELERFMAEGGWGMFELRLMWPRVWGTQVSAVLRIQMVDALSASSE